MADEKIDDAYDKLDLWVKEIKKGEQGNHDFVECLNPAENFNMIRCCKPYVS